MTRDALARSPRLLAAAVLLAALAGPAPALARSTGHARVVRPGTLAATVAIQVTGPGITSPPQLTVTVLLGVDDGHLSTRLKDGTRLDLRFGVHREGPGFALFATTAATGAPRRIGPMAKGGTLTFPGPGKTTLVMTLERVATVAALRRR